MNTMYNQSYLPQTRDVIADNVSSSSSKDLLINQLKGRIFELEQNAQNYEQLNNSHLQLQTRFQALSNEKYKNECELRQKTEIQQKQITELQNENESLQLHLKDKIQINKIIEENNELIGELKAQFPAAEYSRSVSEDHRQVRGSAAQRKSAHGGPFCPRWRCGVLLQSV